MSRTTKLVDPQIVINNVAVKIVPNSFTFTEGFGEQKSETQSAGGGVVEKVDSQNVETNLSDVKFMVFPTSENIELFRSLKSGEPAVITATDNGFTRTFQNATLNNNYEVGLGADKDFPVEFVSEPAV